MRQDILDRESLKRELKDNNYSEDSISYIVNTFFLRGIQKDWEKLTKKICKKYTR
jgi:hypothetical protein